MKNNGNKEYRIKGNFFNENKMLSLALIGAGAGILLALASRNKKVKNISDLVVDKSKKAAKDFIGDLSKRAEEGFSNFTKVKENNGVESKPVM